MYVIFEILTTILHASNLVIKEIKGRTIISDKQNFQNKPFLMVFASKNQDSSKTREDKNLKINSVQVMENPFSFQTLLKDVRR